MFERPKSGEKALLVHIKFRNPSASPDLQEFQELATSAGALVLSTIVSTRNQIDPSTLIGKGKLEEIHSLVLAEDVELVIFNHELSPSQKRNLERELKVRVIDRAELILDIFAQRARTFEGKLQVELAQLQHLSTRLVRGWTHLERQKGGIGLRGPGEKQLEVDRRLIRGRIKNIQQRLEKVRLQREQSRRSRQKAQLPTISLVGYTNAGKSTLFNTLLDENVYAKDQLFATLDPTLRTLDLRYIGKAILIDTVGFIRDLPHDLIDAFRATLEETKDADLLVHVIDAADPLWSERKSQVEAVLHEIGALHVPVLEVYNKIDLVEGSSNTVELDHHGNPARVRISAKAGFGLSELKESIAKRLCNSIFRDTICLPNTEAKLRALLYNLGAIDNESINESGNWVIEISVQQALWQSLCGKFPKLKDYVSNIHKA